MITTTPPSGLSAKERSLALVEEHEPHGWQIETPLLAVHAMVPVPGYFMSCSCGWRGWIMKDLGREIKETYETL